MIFITLRSASSISGGERSGFILAMAGKFLMSHSVAVLYCCRYKIVFFRDMNMHINTLDLTLLSFLSTDYTHQ